MRWLSFFILAYVCLGLQQGLAPAMDFNGAMPDFVLAAVVFVALFAPRDTALLASFILGLLRDLSGNGTLGLYAFIYAMVGLMVVGVRSMLDRKHVAVHFAVVLLGGILAAIVLAVHGWVRPRENGVRMPVLPLFFSAVDSAVVGLIMIAILQKIAWLFHFRRDSRA
jgi:rod shape-determining protein MreD